MADRPNSLVFCLKDEADLFETLQGSIGEEIEVKVVLQINSVTEDRLEATPKLIVPEGFEVAEEVEEEEEAVLP